MGKRLTVNRLILQLPLAPPSWWHTGTGSLATLPAASCHSL